MTKEYTALGLMSGTSGDGVDASIIRSDGENKYEVIFFYNVYGPNQISKGSMATVIGIFEDCYLPE